MATKFKQHRMPEFTRDSAHRLYDKRRYAHPELGPVARFRGSSAWQLARKEHLAGHPFCVDPFHRHQEKWRAQQVHHIVPLVVCLWLGELFKLGIHPLNLCGLCTGCHDEIERRMERDVAGTLNLLTSPPRVRDLLASCNIDPNTYEYTRTQAIPSQA